jgi:hypothetical protein
MRVYECAIVSQSFCLAEVFVCLCSCCSPLGKYDAQIPQLTACLDCDLGKFGVQAGRDEAGGCQSCPVGFSVKDGASPGATAEGDACQACAFGKYDTRSASGCADCEAGRYAAGSGIQADACPACPLGRFSDIFPTTGLTLTDCQECGAGYYGNSDAPEPSSQELGCNPCPVSAMHTRMEQQVGQPLVGGHTGH